MTVKATHPIDTHVGQRVRNRRRLRGLSQLDLADAIGVTFQQVQKYESGANRMSASKLYEIAKALDVPIAYFFEDTEAFDTSSPGAGELSVVGWMSSQEGAELAALMKRLNPAQLKFVSASVKGLADIASRPG